MADVPTQSRHGSARPPDETREARLGHRNLIAFNRALTRWGSRGELGEEKGAVLCAGGTWIPVIANAAFRSDDTVEVAELISRADTFFGRLARGYSVKARDIEEERGFRRACLDAGLEAFGEPVPQMICYQPLPGPTPIDGITVRSVEDEAGLNAFISVNAAAYTTYGMPPEVLSDLFDEAAVVLGDGSAHMVVARRATEPVATAMIFESDGVASVQWVGTIPAARGTGLGALVTTAVTNLAFDRGASSCTLQASPMGAPVYQRLGYETLYHYVEFVRWPQPPGH